MIKIFPVSVVHQDGSVSGCECLWLRSWSTESALFSRMIHSLNTFRLEQWSLNYFLLTQTRPGSHSAINTTLHTVISPAKNVKNVTIQLEIKYNINLVEKCWIQFFCFMVNLSGSEHEDDEPRIVNFMNNLITIKMMIFYCGVFKTFTRLASHCGNLWDYQHYSAGKYEFTYRSILALKASVDEAK